MRRTAISILVVIALVLQGCIAGETSSGTLQPSGELRKVTLKIGGMTCPACPQTIKAALLQLDGVRKVDISLEKEEGTIVYDASKITAAEIASSNIFSWGVYTARVVEDKPLEAG